MADVKIGFGEKNKSAADIIRRRMLAHSETMRKLLPKVRARAVAVTGIEDMNVLGKVREACASVPEGENWKDARKKVAELIGDKGAAKRRAETVLRTNCETARATAHWQNIRKEADIFPYLMYETMRDGQVRPSHKALDGMIVKAGDDFWKKHYPPWDWGCRCTVVQIDKEMRDQLCRDKVGKVMSKEAKQDFKMRFGNEKHTFEFDPEGFGDFTKLDLDEKKLRAMHDALSRDIPGNTVRNERNEPENAWEFLWRTGPQAADNETLRDSAARDHMEHVVVRDAATGEVLERATGGESSVGTKKDWYREGLPGKVRATHIHPVAQFAIPSPGDVITALQNRSDMETVIAEWGGAATLRPKPDMKLRREKLAGELDGWQRALDSGEKSVREWTAWLKSMKNELGYVEDAK